MVKGYKTSGRKPGRYAACGVRDAKRSPSRVVLSLKVRLSLQVCRCEFSAAFHGRPNEQGQSSTITPVLIPFLRTVYSVVQFRNSGTNFGGTFAGFQLRVMLHLHKGWIPCFSIHFAVRSCSVWSRLR